MHSSRKTRVGAFHLRQTLGLVLTGVAGGVASLVPILGWIVWFVVTIGLIVLWFLGLLAALRGDTRPVPILGERYQRCRWLLGSDTGSPAGAARRKRLGAPGRAPACHFGLSRGATG
jgi:uncharacterized membrane protein